MALDFDSDYYSKGFESIVGLDEAGRGCLLGPVVAAAVVLPKDFSHPLIKQLSEKQREEAYKVIIDHAISYAVGIIEPEEIDKINILEASRKAMTVALEQIPLDKYDIIITDFMKLPKAKKEVVAIPHGTKLHLEELEKYGPIKGLHRFSYKPIKELLIEKIKLF